MVVDMKAGSAGLDAHAGHIFISHVEENADVALAIANGLEEAGYTTWCYERDALPGPSYLLQTSRQIEDAAAVVVVISAVSLGSHQVTAEVIRAHESGRPFVPVLVDISHVEFAARQPEWREALGSSTSVMVPAEGVTAIIPRICDGLRGLGITPSAERPARAAVTYTLPPATKPVPAAQPSAGGLRRRWPVLAAVGAALVVVAALVLVLTSGGRDQGGEQAGSRQETTTTAAGAVEDDRTRGRDHRRADCAARHRATRDVSAGERRQTAGHGAAADVTSCDSAASYAAPAGDDGPDLPVGRHDAGRNGRRFDGRARRMADRGVVLA